MLTTQQLHIIRDVFTKSIRRRRRVNLSFHPCTNKLIFKVLGTLLVVAVVSCGGGDLAAATCCARDVNINVARHATVVPSAARAVVARGAAAVGEDQREVVLRVRRGAHDLRQLHAARVHVESARRAAVQEAPRGAATDADVAPVGDVAVGLDENELVFVDRGRVGERLRVTGAWRSHSRRDSHRRGRTCPPSTYRRAIVRRSAASQARALDGRSG
jgi:hypothetical protein